MASSTDPLSGFGAATLSNATGAAQTKSAPTLRTTSDPASADHAAKMVAEPALREQARSAAERKLEGAANV